MKASQQNINTAFEEFIQELPADYQEMAYEFKAFCRARKVKSVFHSAYIIPIGVFITHKNFFTIYAGFVDKS